MGGPFASPMATGVDFELLTIPYSANAGNTVRPRKLVDGMLWSHFPLSVNGLLAYGHRHRTSTAIPWANPPSNGL